MAGSVNWTKEQTAAIETHGCNILVAAAAGSGKTAVLVERIIRMICDTKNPVSMDRLLVLTFTSAAAAEMKRKIAAAIDKKLAEFPDNDWLREQSVKVNSACISTIHSFCSRIIGNNAHLTDLPSDYSIITDETENDILKNRALDDVLEEYYRRIDKKNGFRELVLSCGVQNDKELREIILKLYDFTQSLAYPKRWFRKVRGTYRGGIKTFGDIQNSDWFMPVKREICGCAEEISNVMKNLVELLDEEEIPHDNKQYIYYFNLLHSFCDIYDNLNLDKTEDFKRLCRLIGDFKLPNAARVNDAVADIRTKLDFYRKNVIGGRLKYAKTLITAFDAENMLRLSKSSAMVNALCNIVRLTEKTHRRYKLERSVIDFSDLEHELLKLICDEKGRETPLCAKLREHYYEILLDEFQDTNALQFEIFSHISKPSGNMFMVGDVKQSIYKFRNADPSIFLRLYDEYSDGNGGRLIKLFKNFRSRREVVDSVNHIFSEIMNRRTGGIDYTEDEYLILGANYPEGVRDADYRTEILINDAIETETDPVTHQKISAHEQEAKYAAERIIRLVRDDGIMVTDSESGELRAARFGDIAVLASGWDECLCVEQALNEVGISCFCEKSSHYLDSTEVATVLAFLQIIDNPLQDIPLLAVMRSPIFRFGANELAEIRACAKDVRYYAAVEKAAEDNEKAAKFVRVLTELRKCSKYMGVDELVHKICYDLDYMSIVSAMSDGELRCANLKLLQKRCSDFEQGVLTGLFNFTQYIERLRESKKDLSPANKSADFNNTVTVMTIHKSKGLEFPIVLLFGTDKRINKSDATKRVIWDAELGLAADYVDTRQRIMYRMPQKELIAAELCRALYAERMRLLYVAMTRAKEKLIISASITRIAGAAWKNAMFDKDNRMQSDSTLAAANMRDWVWGAMLAHHDGKLFRESAERLDVVPHANCLGEYIVYDSKAMDEVLDEYYCGGSDKHIETSEIQGEINSESAADDSDDLSEMLNFRYNHNGAAMLPLKLSVSELKRRQMPEEEYSVNLISPKSGLVYNTDEINAAERGTVTHYVMQHIDIHRTDNSDDVIKQVDDMTKSGMITETQRNAVDTDAIAGFFSSPLGMRLKAANDYRREFDFYMLVPAREAEPTADENGGDVMVQGIADCLFFDGDGIVLIDYKTDRVSAESAQRRSEMYRIQTDYYARGLSAVLGAPVTEKYLYFLNCGTAVKM